MISLSVLSIYHDGNNEFEYVVIILGRKRMGRLVVGAQDQLATVNGGPDLEINDQPFYFGGVDPEFNHAE